MLPNMLSLDQCDGELFSLLWKLEIEYPNDSLVSLINFISTLEKLGCNVARGLFS